MKIRYYPALLDFKKAGENRFFVINRNDDITHVLSNIEGNLLMSLSGSRTATEHLEEINKINLYNFSGAFLSDRLNGWIKKNFLRKEELLFKPDSHNHVQKNNIKNLISGCITSNRPDMLKGWLESRLKTADYIDKKTPIIICDDTRINKIRKNNISIAENYRKNYPGEIYHIDQENKIILSKIIKHSLPGEVQKNLVDFSLSINHSYPEIKTTGSNRNALQLITAGFNLYSSDDDIEYRFSSKNNDNDSFHFPNKEILAPSFYPDMETMTKNLLKPKEYNFLDKLENLINSDITSIIKKKGSVFFDNITPYLAMLQEKNLLKIRVISAGYCGGRWYQNPYMPLLQQDVARDLFFYNHEKYRQIRDNGLNIIAAEQNTFDHSDLIMGGTLCIDNKNLLPPCLPFGMQDDTSFSILLNRCLEPALSLHLPAALYHNHTKNPSFNPENFQDVSINIVTYSTLILERLTSAFLNPYGKERLRELGFRFQEFGKLKTADFEEQLKLIQLGFLSKAMNHISYLLDLYEREPVWWAEDMERYYSLLKKEALGKNTAVPRELRSYGTKKEALTVFKNYLFKCGEMLQWWPEIWEAARMINMEGRGIISLEQV